MIWQTISDFDYLSYEGRAVCSICGSTCRKGQMVFRPPQPDDVSGFWDICENCIREAADHLGLGEVGPLEKTAEDLRDVVATAHQELIGAHDALATITRENVRLQDVIEDLNLPLEESFPMVTQEDFDSVSGVHEISRGVPTTSDAFKGR